MQKTKPTQSRVRQASTGQAPAKPRQNNTLRERRKKSSERRHGDHITQFPIITRQGICVRKERRKIPERRMSNIIVKETVMNEEVFETLFSSYLAHKERIRLMKKLNG